MRHIRPVLMAFIVDAVLFGTFFQLATWLIGKSHFPCRDPMRKERVPTLLETVLQITPPEYQF